MVWVAGAVVGSPSSFLSKISHPKPHHVVNFSLSPPDQSNMFFLSIPATFLRVESAPVGLVGFGQYPV